MVSSTAKDGSKNLTTWETYLKEKKLKRKQRLKEAKEVEEPSETSPKVIIVCVCNAQYIHCYHAAIKEKKKR